MMFGYLISKLDRKIKNKIYQGYLHFAIYLKVPSGEPS